MIMTYHKIGETWLLIGFTERLSDVHHGCNEILAKLYVVTVLYTLNLGHQLVSDAYNRSVVTETAYSFKVCCVYLEPLTLFQSSDPGNSPCYEITPTSK